MNRRTFLQSLLGGALATAGVTAARTARAFSLKVTPIPIVISGGATTTMVEIENESQDNLRVQAQVFDWTQTPTGEDTLAPSNELLVFPSMLVIAPSSSRKLRVGTQGGYGPVEKSFRVIFSELPPESSPANGDVVSVVAHVSVPIFVRPPGVTAAMRIEGLTATRDRVRFGVRNTGSAHAVIDKVHVEALNDSGQVIAATEVAGWYVLPGLVRPFEIDVSKTCPGAKALRVTATSRDAPAATAQLDKPACG